MRGGGGTFPFWKIWGDTSQEKLGEHLERDRAPSSPFNLIFKNGFGKYLPAATLKSDKMSRDEY